MPVPPVHLNRRVGKWRWGGERRSIRQGVRYQLARELVGQLGLEQKVVRSGVDTYLDQLRVDPLESEQMLDDAFEPQRPVLRADEGAHDEGNEGFARVARGFGGWEGGLGK